MQFKTGAALLIYSLNGGNLAIWEKKNYTQLLVINDVNVHSHHTPSQSKGVGTALPRRTTGMPLKSKPKLPVTIKLQSRCWFYFGKKKKAREKEKEEEKKNRRRGEEGEEV